MKWCIVYFGALLLLGIFVAKWSTQLREPPESFSSSLIFYKQRLANVESELKELERQNNDIQQRIRVHQNQSGLMKAKYSARSKIHLSTNGHAVPTTSPAAEGPSAEYEYTRRRLESEVQETWLFLGSHLRDLMTEVSVDDFKNNTLVGAAIQRILKQGFDHHRLLMRNVRRLAAVDGHDEWRRREWAALNSLVDNRLHWLQNPRPNNCSALGAVACSIDDCGFGCQLHTLAKCFMVAYGFQRTLLVIADDWNYQVGPKGWEFAFQPVTETCQRTPDQMNVFWRGGSGEDFADVLEIGIFPEKGHPYLPTSVPREFESRLAKLHADPLVWWVSRFLQYLVRQNNNTRKMLELIEKKMKLQKPYVGLQVRRTDKLDSEASLHDLSQYVDAANEYLMTSELLQNTSGKRIYIASDDVTVLGEARAKYSDFEFFGNSTFATATDEERYTNTSFWYMLIDLHFLSNADYLVCTFSSTFCRAAYALMHKYHMDASTRVRSLDDVYFYAGHEIPKRVAIMDHKSMAPGQIDLVVGDRIQFAGNHWDGFSKGKNERTKAEGLFPSFKVREETAFVDFPKFPSNP